MANNEPAEKTGLGESKIRTATGQPGSTPASFKLQSCCLSVISFYIYSFIIAEIVSPPPFCLTRAEAIISSAAVLHFPYKLTGPRQPGCLGNLVLSTGQGTRHSAANTHIEPATIESHIG